MKLYINMHKMTLINYKALTALLNNLYSCHSNY